MYKTYKESKLRIIPGIAIYFGCIVFRETLGAINNSYSSPGLWFFKLYDLLFFCPKCEGTDRRKDRGGGGAR